jgi:hypothetical protein
MNNSKSKPAAEEGNGQSSLSLSFSGETCAPLYRKQIFLITLTMIDSIHTKDTVKDNTII